MADSSFDVVSKAYAEQFDLIWLDQAPMNNTSRTAVMPGHRKVTAPAAILKRPTTTSHQVGTGLALPVKAATSESTPSTSAKAP